MRAVALLLSLSLATAACFPKNEKYQTYAKLTEGGLVAGGVAMLFFTNTGADCDMMARPGIPEDSCHTKAAVLGGIGFGMILTGLIGFIATISTAEDAKPTPVEVIPKTETTAPTAKPADTAPTAKPTQTVAVPPPAH